MRNSLNGTKRENNQESNSDKMCKFTLYFLKSLVYNKYRNVLITKEVEHEDSV